LEVLNYLGRSESWVDARLLEDNEAAKWNCVVAGGAPAPQGYETVKVAVPVPPLDYKPPATARRRRGVPAAEPLSWLNALAFSTEDLLQTRLSEPPALSLVAYLRPERCLAVVPTPRRRAPAKPPRGVLYALESKVLPRVTETLEIAERVRSKLMGIHKRICGAPELVSAKFSGKDRTGAPLTGPHTHAFYLPLDRDADGRLDHLLVVCAEPLDEGEVLALDRLQTIWQSNGKPDLRLTPRSWDKLLEPHTRLVSATPYVPARHYRQGRGDFSEWLEQEIRRECQQRGLPPPVRVVHEDRLRLAGGRTLRWLDFRRSRKDDDSRLGYGFRLEFAEPVAAPLALGYGCHFGLGMFRPSEE
jgi:CRISPR-associated protein Csb2